jgi:hypothetical protein
MAHSITVFRFTNFGHMYFASGSTVVITMCWWDPAHRIDAKPAGYPAYATYMTTRKDSVTGLKRPGIWLGKGVPYNNSGRTSDGIFIHEGKDAGWSDGRIVAKREDVLKIWEAIPQGGANALVQVFDVIPNTV